MNIKGLVVLSCDCHFDIDGLMKTCSVRSKHCDQYQRDSRETNDKTKPFINIVYF